MKTIIFILFSFIVISPAYSADVLMPDANGAQLRINDVDPCWAKKMTFINILASVYYSAISALIAISITLFIALTSNSLLLLISMILISCAAISEYVVDAAVDKAQRWERSLPRNLSNSEYSVSTVQPDEPVKQKQMTFTGLLASINDTCFLGFLALFYGIITISVVRTSSNLLVITVMILVACYFIAACAASAAVDKAQRRKRSSGNLSNRKDSVSHTMQSEETVKRKQMTYIELVASIKDSHFFGVFALFYVGMTLFIAMDSSNMVSITLMILGASSFISGYVASAAVEKAQRRGRL